MKSWYSIQAKAEQLTTEISIFDEIGYWGVSAKQFIGDLKNIPANHKLSLKIHSPGGEVFDGNAIANALSRHPGGFEVQIEGLAASMATVISLGGRPVKMAANGFYMIHNPWGMTAGDASAMREQADLLDKIQTNIVNAYSAKSGQTSEQIQAWMDAETWFTAEEAKAAGFVDEITDAHQMAASATKFERVAKFKNAPVNLTAETIVMEAIPETTETSEEVPAVEVAEEIAPVEEPAAPVEEPALETPVAVIPNADSITAKFNAISAERDAFKALADTYKAKLDATDLALDRLERSLGVAAAKIVPAVEVDTPISNSINLEQFNKMSAVARNEFIRNGGKLAE